MNKPWFSCNADAPTTDVAVFNNGKLVAVDHFPNIAYACAWIHEGWGNTIKWRAPGHGVCKVASGLTSLLIQLSKEQIAEGYRLNALLNKQLHF